MKIEYTTDGEKFHFVQLISTKKKITKIFSGQSKKEVKDKLFDWLIANMPDIPLWKIKFSNYQMGWK